MESKKLLNVELDGEIWTVMEDGTWVLLNKAIPSSMEIPLIRNLEALITENIAGKFTFPYKDQTIEVDSSARVSRGKEDEVNTFDDKSASGLGVVTRVSHNGREALAEAGYQTRDDITQLNDLSLNTIKRPSLLANDATISVFIEDGVDTTINQFEVTTTLIYGATASVEDDREVTVTVSDHSGHSLSFIALVTNNQWTLNEVDLSSLDQGSLVVEAVVTDFYGNSISGNTESNIDTLANISVSFEQQAEDGVLNSFESDNETISGFVSEVEDGQELILSITDQEGNSKKYTTTIIEGRWSIDDLDLSGLVDGSLVAEVIVQDIAGNIATSKAHINKDVFAAISFQIDTGNNGDLNADDIENVPIYGAVEGIEDGQIVTITGVDATGNVFSGQVVVIDGKFSMERLDLTSVAQGILTITVAANDKAGNPAESHHDVYIDTEARIAVEILTNGDGVVNKDEQGATIIAGITIKVEDHQLITITVTDINNQILTFTTVSDNFIFSISEDLSSLAEGPLSIIASVRDEIGNIATAETAAIKDSIAAVTIKINSSENIADDTLNDAEDNAVQITGTAIGVEDGQLLSVVISDTNGHQQTVSAIVSAESWVINNVDLSLFSDGIDNISATATVVDKAGNSASANDVVSKDTNAQLTMHINSSANVVDDTLNDAEDNSVQITGTALGVENGQVVSVILVDKSGHQLNVSAVVTEGVWHIDDIDLSDFADGVNNITASATVNDIAGNPAQAQDSVSKDTLAQLTISINSSEDVDDDTLNNAENNSVEITGTAIGVEDGQVVSVVVEDQDGHKLTLSAEVTDETWHILNVDLSQFSEGNNNITATATASDKAGNPATAVDVVSKDSVAEISIYFEQQLNALDGVLNAAESSNETLSGSVIGVQDNQLISVVVSDENGLSLNFSSTVINGKWSIADNDLSALADGTLTATVNTIDIAGNPASATNTVVKDTLAQVTIKINSSGNVADDTLNDAEDNAVQITGTAIGVEDGQFVHVQLTDKAGNSLLLSAQVINQAWVLNDVDLSGFTDGDNNITATATVSDKAGNTATATDIVSKDSLAEITVAFEQEKENASDDANLAENDGLLNAQESLNETFSGQVNHVENGQTVTLIITDKDDKSITIITTIVNAAWSIDPQDLSQLADGVLTAKVTTVDIAGNTASATTSIIKDSVVSIDIDTDTHNGFDNYPGYNSSDFMTGKHTELAGTTDAEEGQIVSVTITDGSTSVSFDSSVGADGRWLVTGIDISSLDNQKTWNMSASVTDKAGNVAVDEMPEFSLSDNMSFAEEDLATGAISASTVLDINSPNVEYSFSSLQTKLTALTSEGQRLNADIANDGLSISLRRADGKLVMNAVIDLNTNSVSVTLFTSLDHAADSDNLLSELLINVVQTDTDGSTETAVMSVTFDVEDSSPIAIADNYSVIEDATSSSNLLGNDSAIDGDPKVSSVTIDGVTKAVSSGNDAVFNTDKGILTVSQDGTWTFVAAHGLDNSIAQKLEFSYQNQDYDTDTNSAVVTIIINDGAAGSMFNIETGHTEPIVTMVTNFSEKFTINAGSDDLIADSIQFNQATLHLLNDLNITSNGQLITYSFNADSSVITASSAAGIVFTISLSAMANGADLDAFALFQQNLPLDHINSDSIQINLSVQATDTDGTTSTAGVINWTIEDGVNAAIINNQQVNLDEAELSVGNVVGEGRLSIIVGSDNVSSVVFDASKQPALSSGGESVQYKVENGILIAFVGTEANTNVVFTVELKGSINTQINSDMGYKVTLLQAIDQLDSNNEHLTELVIPIVLTVTDTDNDVTDQNLIINITDSGDIDISGSNLSVTETPVAENTDPNITGRDQAQLQVTASFDPVTSLILNVTQNHAVLLTDGSPLTQNKEAVIWNIGADGLYSGVLRDGTVIFEVQFPADIHIAAEQTVAIDISFVMLASVDHNKDLHDANLLINLPILVSDSDLTVKNINITADIIDGDLPKLAIDKSLSMDEGALESGAVSDSVNIAIIPGSDDVLSIEPLLAGQIIPGVTSGGSDVSFAAQSVAGWWIAATSETPIFKIRFNLDGSVETQLLGAIDHPDGLGDNILSISIDIQAIDVDGDTSLPSSININIIDDVPEANNTEIKIVEGTTVATEGLLNNVGADGGQITKVFAGLIAYEPGVSISLYAEGIHYANLIINANGSGSLEALKVSKPGLVITDKITYQITDADGDRAIGEIDIQIADEFGGITLDSATGNEDEFILLTVKVYAGDFDNNEQVEQITIQEVSLGGGSLYFNGQLLSAINGEYILSGADIAFIDDTFQPSQPLTFLPALNSSNQTNTINIDVAAIIKKDSAVGEVSGSVSNTGSISVISVADAPTWDNMGSDFSYSIAEDAPAVDLNVHAALVDNDGSETLTYQIGSIDDFLSLTLNGLAIEAGHILNASEIALLKAQVGDNLSGSYNFTVIPIATESENNHHAQGSEQTITINVTPSADKPTLGTSNVKGVEDEVVLLNKVLNGHLTDTDGSETLNYYITVPDGWSVVAIAGSAAQVIFENGVYKISGADVEAGLVGLLPAANVSSETGIFNFTAQAEAVESLQGAINPDPKTALSDKVDFEVKLAGVADIPIVTPGGNWTYDESAQVISNTTEQFEDQLIALNMLISTEDLDGSESINLLLSNLPDGFIVTDAEGAAISLPITGFDANGLPIYQISLADFQQYYIKPKPDFSGKISFTLDVIVSESDGDAKPNGGAEDSKYNMTVEIEITPVIDNIPSEVMFSDGVVEDLITPLYIYPKQFQDIDGSEVLTALSIIDVAAGVTLYIDAVALSLPANLADYLNAGTLKELLSSGRITVKAPTDFSGLLQIGIDYEITDTSESGLSVTQSFSDKINITVKAEVEDGLSPDNIEPTDITRIETSSIVQVNEDSSAIALDGLAAFYDEDNDGSELIDYLIIQVPRGDDWLVTHPNGAINAGNGRWLIAMDGLTSSQVQEAGFDLLAGVTVFSWKSSVLPSQIVVSARVIDGVDAEVINGSIQVHFKTDGTETKASDISDLQINPVIGNEGTSVDIGGQINTAVAGDNNDILSFKVLASSLPAGVSLSGVGVIADYDSTGKVVVQYVFTEAALATLQLNGLDPDFAGIFDIAIIAIATDGDSGDTLTENQNLQMEILPVVDGVSLTLGASEIFEDTLTILGLKTIFSDSNIVEEGIETLTSLSLFLVDGGILIAPPGVLTNLGTGRWQVEDFTRIDQIAYKAPLHFSGEINIQVISDVLDTANGYNGSNIATGKATSTIILDILPVTDKVDIVKDVSSGEEDTYIMLSGLDVQFVDNDSSEVMFIEITGVPSGALLAYVDAHGNYILLPNNGLDGGSFNASPTYKWSVTAEQIGTLSFKAPFDFSGDINLAVTVTGYEKETDDYVITEGHFVVEVSPVGDAVEFSSIPENIIGMEGDVSHFDVQAHSTEAFHNDGSTLGSDETLLLSVRISGQQGASFGGDFERIVVATQSMAFKFESGVWIATLEILASELDGFDLVSGPNAFGDYNVNITVSSIDRSLVGGIEQTHIGPENSIDSTLSLTPVVDIPRLTLTAESIFTVLGNQTPLGLLLDLLTPAPSEIGFVEISGVPAGVSILNATQSGDVWTVNQADLNDAMLVGLDTEQNFDLSIVPVASLNGDSVSGDAQSLSVTVQANTGNVIADEDDNIIVASADDDVITAAAGNDQITGGLGDDQFVFNAADQGAVGSPANDYISDFVVTSDSINLTNILENVAAVDGVDLDAVVDLSENDGSTTISIKTDGSDVLQNIILTNTSIDDLYGSDATGQSESDILTKLIDDQTFITGQS